MPVAAVFLVPFPFRSSLTPCWVPESPRRILTMMFFFPQDVLFFSVSRSFFFPFGLWVCLTNNAPLSLADLIAFPHLLFLPQRSLTEWLPPACGKTRLPFYLLRGFLFFSTFPLHLRSAIAVSFLCAFFFPGHGCFSHCSPYFPRCMRDPLKIRWVHRSLSAVLAFPFKAFIGPACSRAHDGFFLVSLSFPRLALFLRLAATTVPGFAAPQSNRAFLSPKLCVHFVVPPPLPPPIGIGFLGTCQALGNS